MDASTFVVDRRGVERRNNQRATQVVRLAFRLLDHAAPALAARLAARLWCTPPRYPLSPRALARLSTGHAFWVAWGTRRVAAWQWGEGPAVYLVHGWGGHGGDLTPFVEPLVRRGFRVIAFDAPGHGRSGYGPSGWRQSTFLEFASALHAVVQATAPAYGIVAHSGGVASTALALRGGLRVQRAVFLASMAEPEYYTRLFAAALGLSQSVVSAMKDRLAHRLQFSWDDLSVPGTARALPVPPSLIVHDLDDPEAPWSGAATIAQAWPGSRLLITSGLGHRRLLKHPAVLNEAAAFVAHRDDDDDRTAAGQRLLNVWSSNEATERT